MKQERVIIHSGPLRLEGRLLLPSGGGTEPVPGVVLCHPHPLYGGSMDNNVIYAVRRVLVERGIAVLCFNFRGVGQSEGVHDGGRGEVDDALAAVDYLAGREDIDRVALGLAGYSFGGTVALAAGMQAEAVKAAAAISPPAIPALSSPKPRLVICGAADRLVPAAGILRKKERITGGGAGTVEVIDEADHFWAGCEGKPAGLLAAFFARHLL